MGLKDRIFGPKPPGAGGARVDPQEAKPARRAVTLDADGQPNSRAFNAVRITDRVIDELIGLCRGVLADGIVAPEEARFLEAWMQSNRQAANRWPANVLYPRIRAMLADGVLDAEEEAELVSLLMDLTGGGLSTQPGAASMSAALPLDSPEPAIEFDGKLFCLTGKFVYGPRKKCEAEIQARGGSTHSSPSLQSDYLVVGVIGSSEWIHSTHGRKIEKAVELREKRSRIAIVSEEHWVRYL